MIGADTIDDYAIGTDASEFAAPLWGGAPDQPYLDTITNTTTSPGDLHLGLFLTETIR
ncbi:hypothetical protein [Thetidibacter halocola]|uniref:Uncharacterized protein n=1 Tax=Thetidibacter halocola TaxID=2827239 RepID=A0A8J7WFT3_9RHOB|nr:hypothetical protein [Thetidibacter halocola]MBS0126880.1 hypothetical protein [Thetidibacter halocola]